MDIEQHLLYRGLPRAGAAGDDADRMAERLPDALLLLRGEADPQLLLRFCQKGCNVLPLLVRYEQRCQIFCRTALISVHIGGIQSAAFIVHAPVHHQLVEHPVDCRLRDGLPLVAPVQLLIYLFLELLPVLVQVPLLQVLFHAVLDAALDPHGVVGLPPVCLCDLVHGQEAEAADPAERKGLALHGVQRSAPKFLIDLLYLSWRHLERRQVGRKVAHGMAALIG